MIFESVPEFRVTANLYLPTAGGGPYPAVIGTAGHTRNGRMSATYQHAWIGLVKRGYVVLAFDPLGQGERRQYFDAVTGMSRVNLATDEHVMAGLQCLLTGESIARYFVWDGIRAFDFLAERPEVDPKRIGVAGNSGGGMQAAYLAAFEPRLAAAAPSCYITRWKELWSGPGTQDAEQVMPGFFRHHLDFSDFLLAQAPKPLLIASAIRDYFPIAGARATHQETQHIYDLLGMGERAGYFEYDDGHGWSRPRREATYRWFDRWLKNEVTSGEEPEITTEPESRLYSTPTGQLANSVGSKTVQELNLEVARALATRHKPVQREDIRRVLSAKRSGVPAVETTKALEMDRFNVRKIEFAADGRTSFPGLLFLPRGASKRVPAILYVNSKGKESETEPGSDVDEFVRAGYAVLAIDPRGMGEAALDPKSPGGRSDGYGTAAKAWMLGMSLAGLQVDDLLSAFGWLQQQTEIDAKRIALIGKGSAGPLALFAAALEPRIERVAVESSMVSYMDYVAAPIHQPLTNLIIPGILREFDLPGLLPLIAPRPVWFVSPVSPNGVALQADQARTSLGGAAAQKGLRVTERAEGWKAGKVYADWLAYAGEAPQAAQ